MASCKKHTWALKHEGDVVCRVGGTHGDGIFVAAALEHLVQVFKLHTCFVKRVLGRCPCTTKKNSPPPDQNRAR